MDGLVWYLQTMSYAHHISTNIDKTRRFRPVFIYICNVVNSCAYKVLGKDLCIKEVDVYSVLAWIISITDMK